MAHEKDDFVREEELYNQYHPKVLALARNIITSSYARISVDPEEIANDVLTDLLSGKIRSPEYINSYTATIISRRLARHYEPIKVRESAWREGEVRQGAYFLFLPSRQEIGEAKELALPDCLQDPLKVLPQIDHFSIRWLTLAADLLVLNQVRPSPENWMRKRQDMLIVTCTMARFQNHSQIAQHVEQSLGTPMSSEAVNTRMHRFREVFNDNFALPKQLIPLDQMRSIMGGNPHFGLEYIRDAGIPTVDLYGRPYAQLGDLEIAASSGTIKPEYAAAAHTLTLGKNIPEAIEDSLSREPDFKNLIRLLGIDKKAIITLPTDSVDTFQLSPQDVIDALEARTAEILTDIVQREIYDLKRAMKSIEEIAQETGYTENSIKTFVLRIRKKLEGELLAPARLRPMASYKDIGLKLAVHNQTVPSGLFLGRWYVFEEAVEAYLDVKREIDPEVIEQLGLTPLQEIVASNEESDFFRVHRKHYLLRHKGRLYFKNEHIHKAREEYSALSNV